MKINGYIRYIININKSKTEGIIDCRYYLS